MSDGLPVDPKSLGWGPAPSDPEAATTREFVGPSRWADAKDWTWLQVGRGRWVTARAEADRRIIVVELRGRAAVGEGAPTDEEIERVSARVHDAWMATKRAAGVTSRRSESGEELMVSYSQLSEAAKDLDRVTVRMVLLAVGRVECPHCATLAAAFDGVRMRVPPGRDTPTGGNI